MRAGVVAAVVVATVTAVVPTAAGAAMFKTAFERGGTGYRSWFDAYSIERNNVRLEVGAAADTVKDLGAGVISPYHEGELVPPVIGAQPTFETCQYLVVSATCQRDPVWKLGPLVRLHDQDDTIQVTAAKSTAPTTRIDLGSGRDTVLASSGPQFVIAVDGWADTIRCGSGIDTAHVDSLDVTFGCETVTVF